MANTRARNYKNKKGSSGENEVVQLFRKHFPKYKDKIFRTAHPEAMKFSYNGDVSCFESACVLSTLANEVKRHETESPRAWYEKIKDDCQGSRQKPVVHFRRSKKEWLTVISTEDFISILKELQGWKEE